MVEKTKRKRDMEVIAICGKCKQRIRATLRDAGSTVACPSCAEKLIVPRSPANPFFRPIKEIWNQLTTITWRLPYIDGVIQLVVIALTLAILCALSISIGILSQIGGIFIGLLYDSHKRFIEGTPMERAAQGITISIYTLLALPFLIVAAPFAVFGLLWDRMKYFGVVLYGLLVIGIVVLFLKFRVPITDFIHNAIPTKVQRAQL